MKSLHAFCSAALMVWALFTGAVAAIVGIGGPNGWVWLQAWAGQDRPALSVAGFVAAALSLLWLATQPRDSRFISFDTEQGRVSVGMDAIREFLARLSVELPAVVSARPFLRADKSGTHVTMDLRLRSGASIPEVTRALHDRVRYGMERELGLPPVASVRVRITSLAGEFRKGDRNPADGSNSPPHSMVFSL